MFSSANRAVEVNEMWRLRQKEIELDNRLKGKMKDESRNDRSRRDSNSSRSSSKGHDVTDDNASPTCSSRKREYESCHSREENGLRDEELEEFLHSMYLSLPKATRTLYWALAYSYIIAM